MANQYIQERVIQIITKQLGRKADEITLKSSFAEDLDADSLDLVELVMAFESEFSSELGGEGIPEEDSETLRTVQDVVDYIEKHQSSGSSEAS